MALNEYRGRSLRQLPGPQLGAFPLESIMGGMFSPVPVPGQTRIELGFIGAHADIGGGFAENQNQLAKVALTWMVQQARKGGVTMNSPTRDITGNPVIHDKSDNLYSITGAPQTSGEDHTVTYQNGSSTTQREMIIPNGMKYTDTQGKAGGAYEDRKLIEYLKRDVNANEDGTTSVIPRADYVTGTVDMKAYLFWLRCHGYDIGNLQVQ